jgi:hypothetical protein
MELNSELDLELKMVSDLECYLLLQHPLIHEHLHPLLHVDHLLLLHEMNQDQEQDSGNDLVFEMEWNLVLQMWYCSEFC